MDIRERVVGDVTVLSLVGRMTLAEDRGGFRDRTRALVAQQRLKLVLDFQDLPYVDSSGLGDLSGAFANVYRGGGRTVLCRLSKRIIDLLTITKLITLWDIYDDVDEAVASFGVTQFEVSCPVCRPVTWVSCSTKPRLLSCTECDVRFSPEFAADVLAPLTTAKVQDTTMRLSYLWWQTYYENTFGHEQVQLKFGRPCTISVSGRMDLFAFDLVLRAWDAVPSPQRVVLDMTGARLFSAAGRDRLLALCAARDAAGRAVILSRQPRTDLDKRGESGPIGPMVFGESAQAIAALGNCNDMPQSVDVKIRRRA